MVSRRSRRSRMLLAAVFAATLFSACAPSDPEPMAGPGDGVVVVDVRTPEEFAQGHLEGAVNLPVELPSFAESVGMLDGEGEFLVYCRSGRRAEAAVEIMAGAGLSAVNLGSVEAAAAATGLRVVR